MLSQNNEIERDIWIEALSEEMDIENDEQNINMVIERLYALINNPILINITNKEELEQIPFLSEGQIENLLYYLYVFGEMKSIHELWLVEDFDRRTIDLVSPFFRVEPRVKEEIRTVDNLLSNLSHDVVIRFNSTINKKLGYVDKPDSILKENPNAQYRGSALAYSFRYKIEQSKYWKLGLVLEKDPGEKKLDSYAGYLQLKPTGKVANLILGDYKAHFGLGLVINQGFSLGKNGLSASTLSRNSGFSPHGSVEEYGFLRGIAAEIRLRPFTLYPFWSYRSLDATLQGDTITSIHKGGLHRLAREMERRQKASLVTGGVHGSYRGRNWTIGLTALYQAIDPIYDPPIKPYNRFQYRGRHQANIGVDYRILGNAFSFAGESALSENGALALLHTLLFKPAAGLQCILLQRYYHRAYHSWWGSAFSESSSLSNEWGITCYIQYQLHRFWLLNLGIDWFRFPWLRYGVYKPSSGFETNFQLSYQQGDNWRFFMRYKLRKSDKDYRGDVDSIPVIQSYQRHLSTACLDLSLAKTYFFRTTVEAVFYRYRYTDLSHGFLLAQQAGLKLSAIPFQADLTVALFDTHGSNTRVYLSEKQILYGFGIPSFSGNGMRFALTLRYDFSKKWILWMKYANTCYFDKDIIGTGLEQINGNQKNDVWIQLRCKF